MAGPVIDKRDIARSFGRAASSYDSAAHFQRWVGQQLLENYSAGPVGAVLDLGCGTGSFAPDIQSCLKPEQYVGLDLSEQMACYAKDKRGALPCASWLAGDAESLPFRSGVFDVVFSSLAIQWSQRLDFVFAEAERVLKPGGVFVFSSLLDGTLIELKQSWARVDDVAHVNEFHHQQFYRDNAIRAGFDCERLDVTERVLEYDRVTELARELKCLGAHNITSDRPKKVTGKARLRRFEAEYERFRQLNGRLPATYQVLFGKVSKGEG